MTVTIGKLTAAIEKRLALERSKAAAMAQRVLNYFGFENAIIDNMIDPEDRRLFYELHDAGLLQSSLDAVVLPSGKSWRIFYWELVEADLDRVLGKEETAGPRSLYRDLPPEAWSSHASAG